MPLIFLAFWFHTGTLLMVSDLFVAMAWLMVRRPARLSPPATASGSASNPTLSRNGEVSKGHYELNNTHPGAGACGSRASGGFRPRFPRRSFLETVRKGPRGY